MHHDESYSEPEPGTSSYIWAWLLASVAANLAGLALGAIAFSGVRTMDQLMQRAMVLTPISIVLIAAIMVGVYSLFPRLRMEKVVPYFWGLGALGLFGALVKTATSGPDFPPLYYVMMIVEFVLTVLAVIWGLKRIGRLT